MRKILVYIIIGLLTSISNCFSSLYVSSLDSIEYFNWFNEDMHKDSVPGISTDLAYDILLKGRQSKTVVVAVIDGGVDIRHEDLQGKIWTNKNEIPDNGIDDDHNGFIDDVNGWNFIGGAGGKNIEHEAYEVTRIYRKYNSKFSTSDTSNLKGDDLRLFNMYKKARTIYFEKLNKALNEMSFIQKFEANYNKADSIIKSEMKKDSISIDELRAFKDTDNKEFSMAKMMIINLTENGFKLENLQKYKEYVETKINYHFNLAFNPRSIVNDNPDDPNDSIYGNNDVIGSTPEHGTFVSGIIAGNRDNHIGMKGIADNVKIMVIRAIPDGDERDKDVANAIKYAVNNGAQIINMSFGKDLSPHKEFVDAAIRYAAANNVLLVHAAGNESENTDTDPRYPSDWNSDGQRIVIPWINVGATSKLTGLEFVGSFSNYGRKTVDLFAPGVDIYSLQPGNKYDVLDGTSFSSPMTAGTAALLKSYFPELSAIQIKDVILASAVTYKKQKVLLPESEEYKKPKKLRFGKLSVTGGLLNVYQAVELCEKQENLAEK